MTYCSFIALAWGAILLMLLDNYVLNVPLPLNAESSLSSGTGCVFFAPYCLPLCLASAATW